MLCWACIAPHGGEVIPELAGANLARMRKTRKGMERLGKACREAAPGTMVVITPHGVTIPGYISVAFTSRARGVLEGPDGASICAELEVDRPLAQAVCERAAERGVPVAAFVVESRTRPAARDVLELDWGALVPLWFMGAQWDDKPRVVVICPSRDLPLDQYVEFGRAVAETADACSERIAVICSADLGHGHDEAGPYGFAAESAEYDAAFCKAVRDNALRRLLKWDSAWIDAAMTDSFWPTLMLHGCSQKTALVPTLYSYQAPTYFGMACAEFRRM